MSPCPHPSAPAVSLARLATRLHRAGAALGGSSLLAVELGAHDVALGAWPVPAGVEHPADPLVGFLAPASWHAVGIGAVGRARSLPEAGPGPEVGSRRVRATVVADRDGGVASVLELEDHPAEVLTEAPEGWVADALARALGRPTPPPDVRLSRYVEAAWLDAIAQRVLVAPGRSRSWEELARLHPLAPAGPVLPGPLLAVEAEALDLESSWGRMRRLVGTSPLPPAGARPPGGRAVPADRWFDDGSFSRWAARRLPPAEALLPAVLDALPASVGAELVDALITVGPSGPTVAPEPG